MRLVLPAIKPSLKKLATTISSVFNLCAKLELSISSAIEGFPEVAPLISKLIWKPLKDRYY